MDFLVNAVKAYFNRNWRRQDMMSSATIPEHARTSLKMVYLSLFCAMSAAAYGSHLHLIWGAEWLLPILSSAASLLWLYFTPPWRVKTRVVLLMDAAFCFGASVGPFTKYFFEIDQRFVVRFLQGAAIVFGCFWFAARTSRERRQIYITGLIETCTVMQMWFDITQWMLKVYVLLALFMGYLVLYSQEILYDARFGDIDYVNCAFTVFFCLPAIVVHAVRLCLGANIEQHRQN
ncbi:bax inhibitor 1-like [Solanum dulcamara]|uniref:bax inhibitor 1-like n=1 Tax=Solanum dulcamara TaxID=45834 RepID=UPI002485D12F|nr:bax inhibitor 1-like [Solanum dulcamara]